MNFISIFCGTQKYYLHMHIPGLIMYSAPSLLLLPGDPKW